MGLEMEMFMSTRIEDAVRYAWMHKKTRKKTIPFELATLL